MSYCDKKQIVNRLKRVEGQIRGVQNMISNDQASCKEVITQLSAVRSSVNSLMGIIMTNNLTSIMEEPNENAEQQQKQLSEAIEMIIKK